MVSSFFVNRNPFIVNVLVYVISACNSRYHHMHVTDIPISCGVSVFNIRSFEIACCTKNSNEVKIVQEFEENCKRLLHCRYTSEIKTLLVSTCV